MFTSIAHLYLTPGEMLKRIRRDKQLTQKKLGELLGTKQPHVNAIENGAYPISRGMAMRLGEALNVDYKIFL